MGGIYCTLISCEILRLSQEYHKRQLERLLYFPRQTSNQSKQQVFVFQPKCYQRIISTFATLHMRSDNNHIDFFIQVLHMCPVNPITEFLRLLSYYVRFETQVSLFIAVHNKQAHVFTHTGPFLGSRQFGISRVNRLELQCRIHASHFLFGTHSHVHTLTRLETEFLTANDYRSPLELIYTSSSAYMYQLRSMYNITLKIAEL